MRWRHVGPTRVVAASDLAGKTIDAEERTASSAGGYAGYTVAVGELPSSRA